MEKEPIYLRVLIYSTHFDPEDGNRGTSGTLATLATFTRSKHTLTSNKVKIVKRNEYLNKKRDLSIQSYWACFGLYPSSCMWKTKNPTPFRRLDLYPKRCGRFYYTYKTMDTVQNKPNSSVQHKPSSESFQVYRPIYFPQQKEKIKASSIMINTQSYPPCTG
jgi:hypothetical protein